MEAVTAATNATTCGLLIREFYKVRMDLELQLQTLIGSPGMTTSYTKESAFHPEFFFGYCGKKTGKGVYAQMDDLPDQFEMKELYGF